MAFYHVRIFIRALLHFIDVPVEGDFTQGVEVSSEIEDKHVTLALALGLAPILLSFVFVVFVLYRKRREAFLRQQQAELQLAITEQELRALRAQINPHFIFNCLNSIHHFILKNESKQAGDYLVKFSRLIRLILENSLHKAIPMRDELDALMLYVQLEQLRLDHSFRYEENVNAAVDLNQVAVPPLLIQPFVENAIWHGLANVKSAGYLEVAISTEVNNILILVKNSGSGFKNTDTHSVMVKKVSLGLALIQERLDVLNRSHAYQSAFRLLDDSIDDSIKIIVELRIPKILLE